MLDPSQREALRNIWSEIMVAIVRSYQGKRLKMWTRIPDAMEAAARQTSRLDKWLTLTLRSLQIVKLGSASNPSSLCSIWSLRGEQLRGAKEEQQLTERQVLSLLREERATIVALSQIRWDELKEARSKA